MQLLIPHSPGQGEPGRGNRRSPRMRASWRQFLWAQPPATASSCRSPLRRGTSEQPSLGFFRKCSLIAGGFTCSTPLLSRWVRHISFFLHHLDYSGHGGYLWPLSLWRNKWKRKLEVKFQCSGFLSPGQRHEKGWKRYCF